MTARDYTPIYNGDRYCLMCRHVCPVERITRREATSPHGWALLIASVQRGLIAWTEEAVDTLYQCADCGLCQANCATGRPLPAAIVAARAAVVEQGAMPDSVTRLEKSLRLWGNPYGPLTADTEPNAGGAPEIGLYAGAATRVGSPRTITAAQALLRAAGRDHRLLSMGRSGVYLPYTLGLWDTARVLAEQTLDEIGRLGVREIITLSKEDAHTFQHIYPEIGVTFPGEIRVVEFSAWLDAMLAGQELRVQPHPRAGIVFHDACHTPRLLDTADAPRRVLAALTGAAPGELFWREQQASPCGAIGGFLFTQAELAARLAAARIAEARAAGAAILVADDPHCAAHLAAHAADLPVVNLIEMAAQQIVGEIQ
jgi:Fe-S oxidoreductase